MGSPVLKNADVRARLSANLEAFLEVAGISQNELARRSNVSQKQVNNIVQQRTGCGIDALAALAGALGVAPWILLVEDASRLIDSRLKLEKLVAQYADMTPEKRAALDLILSS